MFSHSLRPMQMQLHCCFSPSCSSEFIWMSCWPHRAFKALKLGNTQNKHSALGLTFHSSVILWHFHLYSLLCTSEHIYGFKLLTPTCPWVFGTAASWTFFPKARSYVGADSWCDTSTSCSFFFILGAQGALSAPSHIVFAEHCSSFFPEAFISVLSASNFYTIICSKTAPSLFLILCIWCGRAKPSL